MWKWAPSIRVTTPKPLNRPRSLKQPVRSLRSGRSSLTWSVHLRPVSRYLGRLPRNAQCHRQPVRLDPQMRRAPCLAESFFRHLPMAQTLRYRSTEGPGYFSALRWRMSEAALAKLSTVSSRWAGLAPTGYSAVSVSCHTSTRAGPSPPIHSGGPGCWTGFGHRARRRRKQTLRYRLQPFASRVPAMLRCTHPMLDHVFSYTVRRAAASSSRIHPP